MHLARQVWRRCSKSIGNIIAALPYSLPRCRLGMRRMQSSLFLALLVSRLDRLGLRMFLVFDVVEKLRSRVE